MDPKTSLEILVHTENQSDSSLDKSPVMINETISIEKIQDNESMETIQPAQTIYLSIDDNTFLCRICLCHDPEISLISPCLCKGSIANVHKVCLERWLSERGTTKCDICLFEFTVDSWQKYSVCDSIRIWVSHPKTGAFFFYDVMVLTIMTIMTVVLIGTLVRNAIELYALNIPENLLFGWYIAIAFVIGIFWLAMYSLAFLLFLNSQIKPWYRWWQSSKNIRLIMDV